MGVTGLSWQSCPHAKSNSRNIHISNKTLPGHKQAFSYKTAPSPQRLGISMMRNLHATKLLAETKLA